MEKKITSCELVLSSRGIAFAFHMVKTATPTLIERQSFRVYSAFYQSNLSVVGGYFYFVSLVSDHVVGLAYTYDNPYLYQVIVQVVMFYSFGLLQR